MSTVEEIKPAQRVTLEDLQLEQLLCWLAISQQRLVLSTGVHTEAATRNGLLLITASKKRCA